MNTPQILDVLHEIPTQVGDWVEAIAEWNNDPDEEDYIIFDEDTPIGWLGINGLLSDDKKAYIKMAALLPEYQNKGIGSRALSQLVEDLKSRGFAAVVLYTDQSNHRAQRCYTKCGFNITKELIEEMSNRDTVKRYRMELSFSV